MTSFSSHVNVNRHFSSAQVQGGVRTSRRSAGSDTEWRSDTLDTELKEAFRCEVLTWLRRKVLAAQAVQGILWWSVCTCGGGEMTL